MKEYHNTHLTLTLRPEVVEIRLDTIIPLNPSVIKIFDSNGKEVRTLISEYKSAGYLSVNFVGSNLSSGIYFYKLVVNFVGDSKSFECVKRMILIK